MPLRLRTASPAAGVLVLCGALHAAERDLTSVLAALGSDRAAERQSAERWIATHVDEQDFPRLAEAAAAGDAELRTRLVRALGSDDRNLALATFFAGELRSELRTLGRDALEEMLLRWSPELRGHPRTRGLLRERLLELHDEYRPTALEMDPATPLSTAVDRLARHGGVPLSLVVDPALADLSPGLALDSGPLAVRGIWDQLLVFLAERDGLGLEGHGLGEGGDAAFEQGFLRVCRRRDEARRTGADLVLEWLQDAAHHDLPLRRAAAARALACTGWPAAIQWLGDRWLATRDAAALEGCLAAAARGQVPRALTTLDAVQRVLAQAETDVAAGGPSAARGWRAVDALASLPPLGAGGCSLAELVVEGAQSRSPLSQWLRLAVLEGLGAVSPALDTWVSALLAEPTTRAALARQALRVHVAGGGGRAVDVADPVRLFRSLAPGPEHVAVARLLLLAGVPPPAEIPPGFAPTPWRAAAFAEWGLGSGRPARAADYLLAAGLDAHAPDADDWYGSTTRQVHELAAELLRDRVFRGEPEVARGLLGVLAERGVAPGSVRRLSALAGVLPAGEHEAAFEAFAPEDLVPVGALAAGPVGERALGALVATTSRLLVADPPDPRRVERCRLAIERAVEELYLARRDPRAELFRGEFQRLAREHPGSAFAARLLQPDWPPPPRVKARPLAALDRRLAPGEL